MRTVLHRPVILVMFLAVLASCGPGKPQKKQTAAVTIRLQWHMQAQFIGYYVAKALGYYKKNSLNVTIAEGGYGKNNLVTVAEGVEQFGTKWPFDLLAQGNKFINIANIVKENGLLLVSRKSAGIRTIRDLVNKTVSIWFIGNEYQLYSALEHNNISRKRVNIVAQKWNLSQFLNRKVDAFSAMLYNELLQLEKKGYPSDRLNTINLSRTGIIYPGHCIFTTRSYFRKNPDICRRFVRASLQGWRYALDNPGKAVQLLLGFDKKNRLDPLFQLKQLQQLSKLIKSGSKPLGYHDPAVFAALINKARKYGIINDSFKVAGFYTNSLIPKGK